MPQSLTQIWVHIIFATKNRVVSLTPEVRGELYPYMATVLTNLDSPPAKIGGTDDHVHILCALSKNLSVAKLVEEVKKPTSRWLKSKDNALESFQWQAGYGAFSVSQSGVEGVREYIENQEEHHRTVTYQEELRAFLTRYNVDFDERYVWD